MRALECSALGVLALFVLTTPAAAVVVCVNPDGSGGCESSIQDGIDAAAAGDTVRVSPGRYEENVDIPGDKDGLILEGTSRDNVILRGSSGDYIVDVDGSDVTLRSFTVKGGGDCMAGVDFDSSAENGLVDRMKFVDIGFDCSDDHCIFTEADGLTVNRSLFYACGASAIRTGDGADDLTVSRSTIHASGASCIFADDSCNDAVIENNEISHCRGETESDDACVTILGDRADVNGNEVSSCVWDGIKVVGNEADVRGNDVWNVEHDAIDVSGTDAMVVSNRSRETTQDDTFEVDGPADGSTIAKNDARDANEDCYDVEGDDITIEKNRARNCGSARDGQSDCYYLTLSNSDVTGNTADHCADEGFDFNGNTDTMVVGNTAKNAAEDGFDIQSSDDTFEKNLAMSNENQGYQIGGSDNTFSKNRARGNRNGSHCDDGTGNDIQADNKGFNDEVFPNGNCPGS